MKTITFYSYKGGVGRTLALANIAKRLAEFGKKVCLIDFDLEAPGLHHKFLKNIKGKIINKGIVDYIHYFNCNNSLPISLTDYVTQINFNNVNQRDIDLIAAGNIYSSEYWKRLFSIDWIDLFYKENSKGVALFIDFKKRIKKELKPDYLLIDSRTGISEISGITMSLLADEIILFAAKNDENIEGLKQIIKTLSKPENTFAGKMPKMNFVLCRVPYFERPSEKIKETKAIDEVSRDMKSFIKESNLLLPLEKIFVIHSDPNLEIEEKFMMGYQYEKEFKTRVSPISLDYLELFEELTIDKLSVKEILRFNKIRKSEFFIKRAQNAKNSNEKIEMLSKAIELNPISDEAYNNLSKVYYETKNYKKALESIEKSISLNPESNDHYFIKAIIYLGNQDISEAEKIFIQVLLKDSKHFGSLYGLGDIYESRNDYKNALKFYSKIIQFYPEFYGGYNSIGNIYKKLKKYSVALEYVYKALERYPTDPISTCTLAEIYAYLENKNEFFKNLELSFSFGMNKEYFEEILKKEGIYKSYFNNERFQKLISKYNLDIEIAKFISN